MPRLTTDRRVQVGISMRTSVLDKLDKYLANKEVRESRSQFIDRVIGQLIDDMAVVEGTRSENKID